MTEFDILLNEIQSSSVELILNFIDINNYYHVERSRRCEWYFFDRLGIKNIVKIKNKEIKCGYVENDITIFKPYSYDYKIYNTHIFILINEILQSNIKSEYYLCLRDEYFYNLYQTIILKYINNSTYELIENQTDKILTIKLIYLNLVI
jgi:hypothetical protein